MSALLGIYALNFLDRQIVNILAEPIKRDLGLADWQLGLMTGFAFALFYTFLGIPIARLAETGNRVRIIAVAMAVWSFFTVLCGFAQNFIQLLLLRIGVGVGEAGCSPPSHSLISDYAPREKRASALAFYSMGIPLGSLAGMVFGGVVADSHGWRTAFILAGAPGLLLAIVAILTLREPRVAAMKVAMATRAPTPKPRFADAMRELRSKRSFWWMSGGAAIKAFITYGQVAFYGSFFFRNHSESLARLAREVEAATGIAFGPSGLLGVALGLLLGVFGVIGIFIGGRIADRIAVKDVRGYMMVPALSIVMATPFQIAGLLTDNLLLAFALLAIPTALNSFYYGPVAASVQSLVQPHTRATASAILFFIVNMVGLGLGPLVIGLMSDLFGRSFGEAEGLRQAMIWSAVIGIAAGLFFLQARRTIREEIVS
ncbi:MAG: MFS transporter [Sphingopyxis macrogoltabida]|uniref:MFS transporter n=1 Tax=Sphingopyxis macrogoltabida TaxID=33050 RepID=A0A2W5MY71_SPHMC|nr:MAG: MFS transporter [Sphingopyxis macrogoltabida]